MPSEDVSKPISAQEAESHCEYIDKVWAATSEAEREEALANEILTFAHRTLYVWHEMSKMASDAQKPFFNKILDKAMEMYWRWMKGKKLTDRPDEVERRALAGLAMLNERPDRDIFIIMQHRQFSHCLRDIRSVIQI